MEFCPSDLTANKKLTKTATMASPPPEQPVTVEMVEEPSADNSTDNPPQPPPSEVAVVDVPPSESPVHPAADPVTVTDASEPVADAPSVSGAEVDLQPSMARAAVVEAEASVVVVDSNPPAEASSAVALAGNPIVQLDAEGNPVEQLDADGNPIVQLDADGNPVMQLDADGNPIVAEEQAVEVDVRPESNSQTVVYVADYIFDVCVCLLWNFASY
jgi:hypothetical protein